MPRPNPEPCRHITINVPTLSPLWESSEPQGRVSLIAAACEHHDIIFLQGVKGHKDTHEDIISDFAQRRGFRAHSSLCDTQGGNSRGGAVILVRESFINNNTVEHNSIVQGWIHYVQLRGIVYLNTYFDPYRSQTRISQYANIITFLMTKTSF
jgi:hypothetical protein